jgi:hypothetical protein
MNNAGAGSRNVIGRNGWGVVTVALLASAAGTI